MTPLQVLEHSGAVLSAVEIARLAGVSHDACYTELNAAEARGLVRILPINGKRSIMGWCATMGYGSTKEGALQDLQEQDEERDE